MTLVRGVGLALLVTGTVVLAACSSAGGTKKSGPATGTTSSADVVGGVAAAKAYLAENSKNPTNLGLDAKLSKKPATGKYIISLETAQPVSTQKDDAIAAAAKVLGWRYERINVGNGAEDPAKAFAAAIARKPDGIHTSGQPKATYTAQLAAAKSAGIAVISDSTTDSPGGGLISTALDNSPQVKIWGKMTAAYFVADSDGKGHAAIFNITSFPILTAYEAGFRDAVAEWCPDCKVTSVNEQASDIGTKIPSSVVSTLQRDPSIGYAAFAFGDMTIGVTSALKSAGFGGKVKIMGETPAAANLTGLVNKTEAMWAGFATPILGWRVVDMFARYFNGDDLGPAEQDAALPTQVLTSDNIETAVLSSDKSFYLGIANYPDLFQQLWLVS